MRIGIIASVHHPIRPPFAGGLERHTHVLATGLLARGHDVVVFSAADADSQFEVVPIRALSRPLRLAEQARSDPSMASDLFLEEHHLHTGLMRALDGFDLDVAHVNSCHYLPVTMAGDVATPMTLTLHTPPTPWLQSAFVHAAPARPWVAAVSQATADAWHDVVEVDAVIPNGVDLAAWRPVAGPVGEHLVWTGRICPEKGTLDAVRAARAAGRPLLLAGPLDDAAYAVEVMAALGPDDRWLGHLDEAPLRALVAGAAAQLVTPRWDEPYGLVVAEALALGTPVAAYAAGGVVEVVDDSSARLAPIGDVDALAAAAGAAVDLDRSACRARAEEVADSRRMVAAYEDALTRAATSGRGGRPRQATGGMVPASGGRG